MTISNGDFVSGIRNSLKALNKDDYVSARYILSLSEGYVNYIINNRPLSKLFRDRNIFTPVECIEMKRIKSYDCCIVELRACDKIMVSKKPLSKILSTKHGFAIEYVLNMTNGEEYHPLRNPADFMNNKKRQFGNLFKYYYIQDNQLYLLNTTTELVNVSAAFVDEDEAKEMSICKDKSDDDSCKSKLENKFVCPEEYLSSVRNEVLNVLLNRANRVEDTLPNLDNNEKGRIQ